MCRAVGCHKRVRLCSLFACLVFTIMRYLTTTTTEGRGCEADFATSKVLAMATEGWGLARNSHCWRLESSSRRAWLARCVLPLPKGLHHPTGVCMVVVTTHLKNCFDHRFDHQCVPNSSFSAVPSLSASAFCRSTKHSSRVEQSDPTFCASLSMRLRRKACDSSWVGSVSPVGFWVVCSSWVGYGRCAVSSAGREGGWRAAKTWHPTLLPSFPLQTSRSADIVLVPVAAIA